MGFPNLHKIPNLPQVSNKENSSRVSSLIYKSVLRKTAPQLNAGYWEIGLDYGYQYGYEGNFFTERVVMQWHSCPGSGGVTVPEGVQEKGRCHTE